MKQIRLIKYALTALAMAVVSPLVNAEDSSSVYQGLLAKYDADNDGRLSAAEREVIRTDRLIPKARERSGRREFRYPDAVVSKFDKDGNDKLDGEETEAARDWIDKRFEAIRGEYDADKDGRLSAVERAALSKQIVAGKFDDLGWLTRFLVRSGDSRGRRERDVRRGGELRSREGILRNSDRDGDGRLNEDELNAARLALKQFEAGRERENSTVPRRISRRSREE
ncbi:MAG TPA: hypothetical protein QGH16_04100 [Verrucomicrobiota bacterium]|jgi:hypothetical protein|nr:hypothetical protein [Verrucomicrobiota bacterium]